MATFAGELERAIDKAIADGDCKTDYAKTGLYYLNSLLNRKPKTTKRRIQPQTAQEEAIIERLEKAVAVIRKWKRAKDVRDYVYQLFYMESVFNVLYDCGDAIELWKRQSYQHETHIGNITHKNLRFLEKAVGLLDGYNPKTLLDICCASCVLSDYVRNRLGIEDVTGIDTEPFEQLLARNLFGIRVYGFHLDYDNTLSVLPQADVVMVMSALHNCSGFKARETNHNGTAILLNATRPKFLIGSDREPSKRGYDYLYEYLEAVGAIRMMYTRIDKARNGFVYDCRNVMYETI